MNAKALKTTLFLSTLFVIVYGSTNMLATHRHSVGSFYFAWERGIPFIARAIVPYMSIDFFFLGAPFLARDEQELKTIARRISVAIILSGLCFLFFPLRFAFNRPPATGILGIIFDRFRNFDQPFNQFPSLHITLAVLLLQIYARRTTGALRALIAAWFTLIVISTLLTFQHHCIDLAGGFALAAVCIYLFPDDPVHSQTMGNRRVAFYYGWGSVILTGLAIVARPTGLLLLWPAFSLAIVAVAYLKLGAGVFQKKNGRMTRASEIILWPVIAGQHLSWLHYRRQSKAWNVLTENVWVGRRLTNSEAASAIDAGVTAVIDLTSEFNAPRLFRSLEYLHLPILDLTAPTPEQLDRAVEFIQSHSINGVVYIHCKAGYSRTAAVAGAFLLATAQAGDTQEAISLLRTARPTIIIRPEACKSIVQYHARRRNGSPRTPLQTTPNPLPCLAVY